MLSFKNSDPISPAFDRGLKPKIDQTAVGLGGGIAAMRGDRYGPADHECLPQRSGTASPPIDTAGPELWAFFAAALDRLRSPDNLTFRTRDPNGSAVP